MLKFVFWLLSGEWLTMLYWLIACGVCLLVGMKIGQWREQLFAVRWGVAFLYHDGRRWRHEYHTVKERREEGDRPRGIGFHTSLRGADDDDGDVEP